MNRSSGNLDMRSVSYMGLDVLHYLFLLPYILGPRGITIENGEGSIMRNFIAYTIHLT
jgi:hypothetical protein